MSQERRESDREKRERMSIEGGVGLLAEEKRDTGYGDQKHPHPPAATTWTSAPALPHHSAGSPSVRTAGT